MAIYAVTFNPSEQRVPEAREQEMRLEAAAQTLAVISTFERALVVFPAGFLIARSAEERDRWAVELRQRSRVHGGGVVFGIDVAAEDAWQQPDCRVYACDAGEPLCWSVGPDRERNAPLEGRVWATAGGRIALLIEGEVFRPIARTLVEGERPDMVVILAHGGATPRWTPALLALDRLAPTFVAYQSLPRRRTIWAQAPRGWHTEQVVSSELMTLRRFAPDPVGELRESMGH